MFSLLAPFFLGFAAFAAIPLVLHLMQRSRTVRVPFSTVRFLKMAQKRSSNRIRMENFLLWLIRTLLMLVIAAAFAMPMLRTSAFGKFLSRSQRDIAIVLDASYSMGYQIGREAAWDKAIQCAISIVEGLDNGDKVCIFLATDDVKPLIETPNGDRAFAVSQLRSLKVGLTSSQLCPATWAAYSALLQDNPRYEREVHIITDGQALPWFGFQQSDTNGQARAASGAAAVTGKVAQAKMADNAEAVDAPASTRLDQWKPEKIDKKTAFFITVLGVSNPENVTTAEIAIQPPLIMADTSPRIQVQLNHTGQAPNTSLSVFVDDKEVGNRAVVFGAGGNEEIGFTLPPATPGIHYGHVQTLPDNLPIDDKFYFVYRVRESLPSLCVGEADDTFYLLKALNAALGENSSIKVKRIGIDELSKEDLHTYSVLFLCNGLPLPAQAVAIQIEQYVKNGGLLVVFPGNRANLGDYQVLTCLPGIPTAVTDITESMRKKVLRWEKPQHPILRTLKLGPGGAPVLTISRSLEWDKIEETAEPLIVMGDKEPFLLNRNVGRGGVLLFSVPADRSWSTFPLSPFYLPIIHQVAQYGAAISGLTPYLKTTRSLSLAECLPTATPASILQDPDKKNVPIRSSIVNNNSILRAEDLLTPGIYRISKPNSTDLEPALALNLDRAESNLTPINRDEIPKLIGAKLVNVAGDKEDLLRLIKDFRVGRTLGEMMLWIAFLLAILELLYANFKAKSAPSLTDALGVEASGKVTGSGAGSGTETT